MRCYILSVWLVRMMDGWWCVTNEHTWTFRSIIVDDGMRGCSQEKSWYHCLVDDWTGWSNECFFWNTLGASGDLRGGGMRRTRSRGRGRTRTRRARSGTHGRSPRDARGSDPGGGGGLLFKPPLHPGRGVRPILTHPPKVGVPPPPRKGWDPGGTKNRAQNGRKEEGRQDFFFAPRRWGGRMGAPSSFFLSPGGGGGGGGVSWGQKIGV